MDIQKTLETIGDAGSISVDIISLAKGGLKLSTFTVVLDLLGNLKELVGDAPLALPELTDLDAGESAQLGAAAYDTVKKIMAALAAS